MKIKDLPPKLQELAIKRTKESWESLMNIKVNDNAALDMELNDAFDWRNTMEELSFSGYWAAVNMGHGIEEKEAALWKE